MSRSHRKNKIFGHTCKNSEKWDKINANKKLRRLVKVRIAKHYEILPLQKEVSHRWWFAKYGKQYWANAEKKDMSK
ncbi:hypothetical protein [Flavobacterium sp.]|uniref:hypothetical protein n=1 Tax=Flavobacterium sp. TaxID=239 RepID=UPI00286DD8B5|nr:hypothetical protein [Flavobacterium sp.]